VHQASWCLAIYAASLQLFAVVGDSCGNSARRALQTPTIAHTLRVALTHRACGSIMLQPATTATTYNHHNSSVVESVRSVVVELIDDLLAQLTSYHRQRTRHGDASADPTSTASSASASTITTHETFAHLLSSFPTRPEEDRINEYYPQRWIRNSSEPHVLQRRVFGRRLWFLESLFQV
jgi:hypothetical protein